MFELLRNSLLGRYFIKAGTLFSLVDAGLLGDGVEVFTIEALNDRILYVGEWDKHESVFFLDVTNYLGTEAVYSTDGVCESLSVGGQPTPPSLYPLRPLTRGALWKAGLVQKESF